MAGRSIHIGLNHVDPNAYGGWDGALAGCINDANAMKGIADGLGFRSSIMIDSQATSATVIAAISGAASELSTGDLLLLTYSGHGGQVPDANNEEEDPNDETWVLWDRQLIDDELFQLWSQFQPGVRIFVLSDSCHSGTVVKVMAARQFRAAAKNVPDTRAVESEDRGKNMPLDAQYRDVDARRTLYDTLQWLSGAKSSADCRASVLLISGCQDNQLSYDGDVNGRFTQELLTIWGNGSFVGDYREFHRQILDKMPPDQSPNLYTAGAAMPDFERQRPFAIPSPTGGVVPSQGTGTRPTIRRGDQGPDVRYMQERLQAHGFSISVDGYFGPQTESIIQQFQRSNNLSADGIVGPMTWQALDRAPTGGGVPVPVGGGTGGAGGNGSGGGMPEPVGGGTGAGTAGGATGGGMGGGSTGGGSTGGGTAGGGATGGAGSGGTARPTLRQGDSGEHVRYLQERLIEHGYSLEADGAFGPFTASIVRTFQRENSLTPDGIVGQQTWTVLERQPAWA
jgi:metacaspase-1